MGQNRAFSRSNRDLLSSLKNLNMILDEDQATVLAFVVRSANHKHGRSHDEPIAEVNFYHPEP